MYNIYIRQQRGGFVFFISIYIKLCQCGKTIILSTKGLIQVVRFQLRHSISNARQHKIS